MLATDPIEIRREEKAVDEPTNTQPGHRLAANPKHRLAKLKCIRPKRCKEVVATLRSKRSNDTHLRGTRIPSRFFSKIKPEVYGLFDLDVFPQLVRTDVRRVDGALGIGHDA
jgi:hypothetical protein